ncbi:MAG: serine/threonine protein kinase [Deltaproteobacteria bacterium]|nr:serine/threonine protein kinase [Deltaproteobacteria bacterium]
MVEPGSNKPSGAATPNTTGELRQLGAGQTLGRYTLIRRVATGGMAEVYAARTHGISGFEKKVAIKKILPQFSLNERFIDMLVDEAKITVSLTHPNIAQVYELGLEGDTYYIVMEYVDGRPLNRLLQKIDARGHLSMPLEHAVHIMVEVTKGLHHAHNQRDARGNPLSIVHRDVSPQNVLVAYSGDVKLIDFGIARAEGRAQQTTAGTIKGKLRYLAPEIARGEEPDHRADIFCCGIVLFELLTGEAMFAPRTDVEAIEMASQAKVRSPRLSNPAVPRELEDIVMRALESDRETRYQTAKVLYTDLRRFLNQHYPAYVGSELGDYMQQLFSGEIEEDRRLDTLAEKVIEKSTGGTPRDERSPAIEAIAPAQRPGYKELVTRSEVSIPAIAPPIDDLDAEDAIPTTAGVPRRGTAITETETSGGSAAAEGVRLRIPAAPAGDQRGTLSVERPVRGKSARAALLLLAAGIIVAIVMGVMRAGTRGSADELPSRPVVGATSGGEVRLTLEVSPKVPVDVYIDGQRAIDSAAVPVELPIRIEGARELDIELRAEGYHPKRVSKLVQPGNNTMVTVALEPLTTIIEVRGIEAGQLRASRGVVRGTRVEQVPLTEPIKLTVERPGAEDWSAEVQPSSTEPILLDAPKPRLIPRGRLFVNVLPPSEVWVNGQHKGTTPLTLGLAPGRHKVKLKAPDGRIMIKETLVRSGALSRITFNWRN